MAIGGEIQANSKCSKGSLGFIASEQSEGVNEWKNSLKASQGDISRVGGFSLCSFGRIPAKSGLGKLKIGLKDKDQTKRDLRGACLKSGQGDNLSHNSWSKMAAPVLVILSLFQSARGAKGRKKGSLPLRIFQRSFTDDLACIALARMQSRDCTQPQGSLDMSLGNVFFLPGGHVTNSHLGVLLV